MAFIKTDFTKGQGQTGIKMSHIHVLALFTNSVVDNISVYYTRSYRGFIQKDPLRLKSEKSMYTVPSLKSDNVQSNFS